MTSHTHPDPVAAGGPLDVRPIVVGIDSSWSVTSAVGAHSHCPVVIVPAD